MAKNNDGVKKRNRIAQKYKDAFHEKIKFQELPFGRYNAHHLFVIEVEDRLGLYEHLKSHNIYAQIHYIPVHTLPYYRKIGYSDATLDNSERYYNGCISLPMFPTLTEAEQQRVIDSVLNFLDNNAI